MVGVGGGTQIVVDSGAGHLQVIDTLFPQVFFRAFGSVVRRRLLGFDVRDLCFDVLAFPTSGHTYIVA